MKRQKNPAFHYGIDPRYFAVAKLTFGSPGDTSALTLSADDAMIARKIGKIWNPDQQTWSIFGHVSRDKDTAMRAKIELAADEDLKAVLKVAQPAKRPKVHIKLESIRDIP